MQSQVEAEVGPIRAGRLREALALVEDSVESAVLARKAEVREGSRDTWVREGGRDTWGARCNPTM